MARPRSLITLGDPAGVGPEVVAKALAELCAAEAFEPGRWMLLGNRHAFESALAGSDAARLLAEALMWLPLADAAPAELAQAAFDLEAVAAKEPATRLWAVDVDGGATVEPGSATAAGGIAAHRALECALQLLALRDRHRQDAREPLGALVTAPLSKAALELAGAGYLDHTTRLAEVTGREAIMSFVGGGLRVALATVHVPLAEVPRRLAVEPLARLIVRAATALGRYERLTQQPVRVAMCGVNPHAGEGGLIGREDIDIVAPAIEHARAHGLDPADPLLHEGEPVALDLHGPLPADTVFHRAREGEFDVVIAMYHDQALCAVKTLAFHEAVNATLNLPFVRTSPDHGTAYDRAGQGTARPDSMQAAIQLAERWSGERAP